MPFVLDASVALAWAFRDEVHPLATRAFALIQTDEALAPALWWYEVRNVLVRNERAGRLREANSTPYLSQLQHYRITLDFQHDESRLLSLTRRRRLSIYDASYLELAQRAGLPLATLDQALQRAARAEGVALLQSSSNGS